MDAELPTAEAMTAYAANIRYGVSCREAHFAWAIGLAIEAERFDLVTAYCQIRSRMRASLCPARRVG